MKSTANDLQIRIHKLHQKDPVMNANIINKLKRRLRAMQN